MVVDKSTTPDTGSTYDAMCWGNCLAGIVPNGGFAQIATDQDITIGGIVSVVTKHAGAFRQFSHRLELGELLGVFKIFLGTLPDSGGTIYLFGQLNPPLIAPVREDEIEAMHLLTSVQATEMMIASDVDEETIAAGMGLLAPFFQKCDPVPPINPTWRPPEKE